MFLTNLNTATALLIKILIISESQASKGEQRISDNSNDDRNNKHEFWCGNNESYSNQKYFSAQQQQHHTRRQYELRTDAILEIGIFFDPPFYHRFREYFYGFVRTLLRQTQVIFEYRSLVPSISLIVKFVKPAYLHYNFQTETDKQYLDRFCVWQNTQYPYSKRKDLYDFAILLTSSNMHTREKTRGLGVAEWCGACNTGANNCLVTHISGFHSAYILAHEIGHIIGALHDYDINGWTCEHGIMSSVDADPYRWSNCSNQLFINYLQPTNQYNKSSDCLFNRPHEYMWDFQGEDAFAPSSKYSYDQQCQVAYGSQYKRDNTHFADEYASDTMYKMLCRAITCSYGLLRITPAIQGLLLEGTECQTANYTGKCVLGFCKNS